MAAEWHIKKCPKQLDVSSHNHQCTILCDVLCGVQGGMTSMEARRMNLCTANPADARADGGEPNRTGREKNHKAKNHTCMKPPRRITIRPTLRCRCRQLHDAPAWARGPGPRPALALRFLDLDATMPFAALARLQPWHRLDSYETRASS